MKRDKLKRKKKDYANIQPGMIIELFTSFSSKTKPIRLEVNKVTIYGVYGKVLKGYDYQGWPPGRCIGQKTIYIRKWEIHNIIFLTKIELKRANKNKIYEGL